MKKFLLILAATLAIMVISIASVPAYVGIVDFSHTVYAADPCPVCGNLVGYGGQIKWETWTVNGLEKSGWILRCEKCGYTTERDANGNTTCLPCAQRVWQFHMFPWLVTGIK